MSTKKLKIVPLQFHTNTVSPLYNIQFEMIQERQKMWHRPS